MDGMHTFDEGPDFGAFIERLAVNRGARRYILVKCRRVTMSARVQEPCMVDVQLSVECRLR